MARIHNPLELSAIPVIDCGVKGAVHLARQLPERMNRMLDAAESLYTRPILAFIDRRSARWLARNKTPYVHEILEIAGLAGRAGASALNISYEWACTSGARDGVLWRSLDWPFPGLGSNIVVARHQNSTGEWLNVTWPGFAGALTAMKPGRFAAALNQAPLRQPTGFLPIDWLVDRVKVDRTTELPPVHALRQAFETCGDFAAAFAFLRETPIALPALIILAGPKGEVAIIERQEHVAIVHQGPGAIANHWVTPIWRGRPRGGQSHDRRQEMMARIDRGQMDLDLDWLKPPVLNKRTRLAIALDVCKGRMTVMGLERSGETATPATGILRWGATETDTN